MILLRKAERKKHHRIKTKWEAPRRESLQVLLVDMQVPTASPTRPYHHLPKEKNLACNLFLSSYVLAPVDFEVGKSSDGGFDVA